MKCPCVHVQGPCRVNALSDRSQSVHMCVNKTLDCTASRCSRKQFTAPGDGDPSAAKQKCPVISPGLSLVTNNAGSRILFVAQQH